MPTYAYKCNSCDYQFDVRQRFSEDPLTICPRCGGEIRRVISSVGVVFKGSGFYVTDNRNGRANGATAGVTKKSDETANESGRNSDSSESTPATQKKDTPAGDGASP